MRWCGLFALIILGGLAVSAAPQTAEQADVGELLRLETAWNDAHVAGDVAALDRLWASTLVVSVPGMPAMGKADSIGVWKNTRMKFERYDTSDVRVSVYGEAAVVTGRVVRVRTMADRRVEDNWLFTKTYVRQSGRWLVVAWHASPAP